MFYIIFVLKRSFYAYVIKPLIKASLSVLLFKNQETFTFRGEYEKYDVNNKLIDYIVLG